MKIKLCIGQNMYETECVSDMMCMKNYAKGVYNLQIITDTGIVNKKVVLE